MEILSETKALTEKGFGNCIGRPINQTDVRLIKITDKPITTWSEELTVPQGDTGELVVRGPLVSPAYFNRPDQNAIHKIKDGSGFWHRMGDLGWKDTSDRIWFCGRKSHRVITAEGPMYSVPCEAVFNTHEAVYRSALVGYGSPPNQKPIICIELEPNISVNEQTITKELLAIAATFPLTRPIRKVLYHKSFPVDIRHNSKIFREKLAVWAAEQLKKQP